MAMNDFNIGFIGGLDGTKSKAKLNQDIDAIKKTLKELELKAKLDPNQVKSLETQLNTLKVNLTDAKFSQSALDGMVSQINNALKGIKIPSVSVGGNANVGQQIGNNIAQVVASGVAKATTTMKSFSQLTDSMKSQKVLFDSSGLIDEKNTLNEIKKIYSEFGQVKITNKVFDSGELQSFKVNIEQVNGELKETRTFMMQLSENGKFFVFPDDVVKGTEKYVQHLNAAKNATNVTGEALNAQNQRLADQAKYYGKIKDETNHLYSLKQKLLSADELQTAELNKQIKSTKQRITYNSQQLDKKGLRDNSLDREINDLTVAREKQLALSDAKAQDVANTKAQAQAQKEANAVLKEQQALQENVNKIQLSMSTGGYESKVDSLIGKTQQWVDANGNARISTDALQTAMNNLNTAYANITATGGNTVANQQALIEAERALDTEVKKVQSSVTSMNATMAKSTAVDSLRQKVQQFYDINTKSHRTYGVQLKAIISELASGAEIPITRLRQIQQEFIGIQNSARQAGKLGLSFFDTLKQGMKSFSYWTSSTFLVMKTITEIKQAVSTVKALDTALVDLRKTTTMTAKELEDFYYASNETAKKMGVTTQAIIEQASAWSRLGYSSQEAATKMAEYSSMFATISPGMDLDSATDGLVSVMKAFKIGAEDVDDVVDGIMSKINIIGNTQALNNSDIVDFLTRSSSAMAEANNSLEETIALGTAATEITRDAASVGNMLKTVSMRIRGYDEETESYSEELENLSGKIADLTKTASSPGGISLFTDASKTTYKSTYQILKDISEIYDELEDKTQANNNCLYVQKCA